MNRLRLMNWETVRRESCQVISVLSGKGGVGKSILCYNLADQLALQGKKVLLVDADFSSGSLHIMANVRSEFGIRQFVGGELSLAEAIHPVSENLDLLGASWTGAIVDGLDVATTANMVSNLREQGTEYDFILLDHGSGISKSATVMAHGSDIAILVIVPELTSIADGYGLYKYLIETNRSLDCRLLVNRCQSDEEADYIHRKFTALSQRFLKQSPALLDYLLETPLYRKALARQLTLSAVAPQSLESQSLKRIARNLDGTSLVPQTDELSSDHSECKENSATADIKG